jgi:hypothetical protein
MKKRILAMILAALMLLMLAACEEAVDDSSPAASSGSETVGADTGNAGSDNDDDDDSRANPIGEVMGFPEPDENGSIFMTLDSVYDDSVAFEIEGHNLINPNSAGLMPASFSVNGAEIDIDIYNIEFSTVNVMDELLVIMSSGTDIFGSTLHFFNKAGERVLYFGSIGESGLLLRSHPELDSIIRYSVSGDVITISLTGGAVAHGMLFVHDLEAGFPIDLINDDGSFSDYIDDDTVLIADFEIDYNMTDNVFGEFVMSEVIMTYEDFKNMYG